MTTRFLLHSILTLSLFFSNSFTLVGQSDLDFYLKISQFTPLETKDFLREIFRDDQRLRNQAGEIFSIKDSIQRKIKLIEINDSILIIDAINQKKVEIYLSIFQYPDKKLIPGIPEYAIWAVIHHCGDLKYRLKFYPVLLFALENKLMDEGKFEFYGRRTLAILNVESEELYLKWSVAEMIDALNEQRKQRYRNL